ncbi:MAG: ABC transporter permease [Christensenellales bacterium]
MIKSARLKDIGRELWKSRSRLLAVLMIVGLGSGFFAGITASGADMRTTADQYYRRQKLMDLRAMSSYGFEQPDVSALADQADILNAIPGYCVDALMNNDDQNVVVRVYSLDLNSLTANGDESELNRTKLLSGRFPRAANECVVEDNFIYRSGADIGDRIRLILEADSDKLLHRTEYDVVGIVESPLYISFERGYSTIGSGSVDSYVMVPRENFESGIYTVVYLSARGADDVSAYDEEYGSIIDNAKERLEAFGEIQSEAQYQRVLDEADAELSEAKNKLADGQREQEEELGKARKELDDAYNAMQDARSELDDGKAELSQSIAKANRAFQKAQAELDTGEALYHNQLQAYNIQKQAFETALITLQGQLDLLMLQINGLKEQIDALEESSPLLPGLMAQMELLQAAYHAVQRQITEGQTALALAKDLLDQAEIDLENGKAELKTQKAAFIKQRKKAEQEIAKGEEDLFKAQEEYEQGIADYNEAERESDAEILKARTEINDAEKEIADLEKPQWVFFTREDNPGYTGYGQNADRMDAISSVFPVFFLIVAALVCLTTMTRMVDEQRMQIGILKALGYGKFSIAMKFIVYAVTASVIGCFTGLLVGFRLFPTVVARAYNIMYHMPPLITPFRWDLALISLATATVCTSGVALFASYHSLMAQPSELIRPKAPRSGKTIFLEKVPFIWSRLKFLSKVTARNLFRYKRRMLMIIIGIAGCTALMIGGFSLKKSVSDVTVKQFGELDEYDIVASLDDDLVEPSPQEFSDKLAGYEGIEDVMLVWQSYSDIASGDHAHKAWIFAPKNTALLEKMIHFRTRIGHKAVPLTDDGVVITEKLSQMLHVSIGDEIQVNINHLKRTVTVPVSGIIENYISHYVFFSPKLAESLFKEDYRFNAAYITMDQQDLADEKELTAKLIREDGVLAVSSVAGLQDMYQDVLYGMNSVVLVMILSAGLLAIIVLYNLTNINVTERYREIATIKVLGFFDKEVSAYVYRENTVLTMIGIILGGFLGKALHELILNTATVDILMFSRDTDMMNYLVSIGLTIAFSLIVNFVVYFKLKRIGMVESLKAVE